MGGLKKWAERRPIWAALLAGAVAGLGQVPVSLAPITLVILAVVFHLHRRCPAPKTAAIVGFGFGFGYFLVTLLWILEPFFVDIARHGWMAPFALAGLAAGMALFWAVAGALAKLVSGPWAQALAWAAALALAELARSYVLTGFPWALIGHVWIGWGPMQLAAWIGPHGLTFLTVLFPALMLGLWPKRAAVLATAAVALALAGGGAWQARQPVPDGPGTVVRLVQPNAAQHLKWHPDHVREFFDLQVALTAAGDPKTRPDLIVWPETAVPTRLENAGYALALVSEAAQGVPVALGIQRFEAGEAFNSLAVIDSTGAVTEVYDKHHLVPFGEYIPALWVFRYLPFGAFVQEHGFGYTPGPGARVLDLGALGRVLPLICYEAIFPQDLRVSERPDWLLQVTNDAWFGNWVGPYQHLAQARLRAVEQGLPMARVANTGVSAMIDPRGTVTAQLPLNKAGYRDVLLPGALAPTVYASTGDGPWAVLYLLLLGAAWGAKRRIPIDLRSART